MTGEIIIVPLAKKIIMLYRTYPKMQDRIIDVLFALLRLKSSAATCPSKDIPGLLIIFILDEAAVGTFFPPY